MSADLNMLAIMGRLVDDCRLVYTKDGTAISNFTIANNATRKKGDDWEDVPMFFDCTLVGKRADSLKQYMTKGKQVVLQGALSQKRWEDKEGNKRQAVGIRVISLQFCSEGKPEGAAPKKPTASTAKAAAPAMDIPPDDEIPF